MLLFTPCAFSHDKATRPVAAPAEAANPLIDYNNSYNYCYSKNNNY